MQLAMFRELYDIENRARNLETAGRLDFRQREATAVWTQLRVYIDTKMTNVLPKEVMGKAVDRRRQERRGA